MYYEFQSKLVRSSALILIEMLSFSQKLVRSSASILIEVYRDQSFENALHANGLYKL